MTFGGNVQPIYLETKCHSGCSETGDVAVGGRLVGVEMSLERFLGGHFVREPYYVVVLTGTATICHYPIRREG